MRNDPVSAYNQTVIDHSIVSPELVKYQYFTITINPALCNVPNGFAFL